MDKIYVNYHKHTCYSNIYTPDTHSKVEDYCKRAKELGHNNYFTTEHGFGGSIFYSWEMCQKYELNCVYAIEGYIVKNSLEKDSSNNHIIIIPKNNNARKKLNKLNSHANTEGFYYKPRIFLNELLECDKEDFYITTACIAGIIRDDFSYENIFLPIYKHFKENVFLETQNHDHEKQKEINKKAIELSDKFGLKLIHANDSHYIYPKDAKDRQILLSGKNINYGDEDIFILDYPDYNTIVDRYKKQGVLNEKQIKEAIENTLIFDNIKNIEIDKKLKIPNIYKNLTPEERLLKLRNIIKNEFDKIKIKDNITNEELPKYKKAILEEFKVLQETLCLHTMDYFLLNKELIDLATHKYGGILTTTSRGSAGAYYINRLLGITQLDRIRAKIPLYYERFLSTPRLLENNSTADCDFNVADPEPFIKASKELLGDNGCKWMIAYGTMQEAEAFRNVCRAHNIGFDEFNEIAKNIDNYRNNEKWKDLIEESQKFINVIVSMSAHPCANLLFDDNLEKELGVLKAGEFICCPITSSEADSWGWLKNDYLTVSTVSITQQTFDLIGIPRMSLIELEKALDNKVWDIYEKGLTCTINQIDSDFGTQYAKRYKPKNISELSMLTGAIRPNFVDFREDFINRKPYFNECSKMDKLFESTNHFIVFQENLMQFFEWLGITPAKSIGLIKKISKKKIKQKDFDDLVVLLKTNWIKENGSDKGFDSTWEKIQSMISYGYNSPHALAMAYDSLYGAYLKSHYPLEYYSVVLNSYSGDEERTNKLINELSYFNITLYPPRFGKSIDKYFMDKQNNAIYKGVASIKFMNKDVANELYELSQNNKYNLFIDLLYDIMFKTSANSRQIDILIKSGYFNMFGNMKDLLYLYGEFKNGKNKITKTLKEKSVLKRLQYLRELEESKEYEYEINDYDIMVSQLENGIEYSVINKNIPNRNFLVSDIKYYKGNAQAKATIIQLCSGKVFEAKFKSTRENNHRLSKYDYIRVSNIKHENKWYKDEKEIDVKKQWKRYKDEDNNKEYVVYKFELIKEYKKD